MIQYRNQNIQFMVIFSSYYNTLGDIRQLQITVLKSKHRKCSKNGKMYFKNTEKGVFSLFVILFPHNK